MQIGSGLMRFKSAPSYYFDSFFDGVDDLELLSNPPVCIPETQGIFDRFMSTGDNCSPNTNLQSQSQMNTQFWSPRRDYDDDDEPDSKKPRQRLRRQQSDDFSSVSRAVNRSQNAQVKMENHSLVRQSSSPAGLFDSINIEDSVGNYGAGNIANPESSVSSTSRFKNKTVLPPRTPSSAPAKMTRISGFGSKDIGENRSVDVRFGDNVPDFRLNQWDDSILSDDFFSELTDDDIKPFPETNALDDQENEGGNRPTTRLSHHLSLPKNLSDVEKLLQDSVPCKLRAKRGFATHPRSIAERVRRTKISDRIRKLQELVPNMDKQTNTADMLDLAVDYIKDLQRQVKTLSENGANCGCSAMK